MPADFVSIIMPVYNCAPYLRQAIDSMLAQSFPHFELLIIDDGSADGSAEIIKSYTDHRIRHTQNGRNMGLPYTLNLGLRLSSGNLVARMDGDDISKPDRLEKQVAYLHDHPEADLVASTVELIDEQGQSAGNWPDDTRHISPAEIRNFLPVNNCIAHPAVVGKASVLKAMGYLESQKQAEDYDLWLRLESAGYRIHKLPESLVRHRMVSQSFTRRRQQNVFFKLALTKFRFVLREWGQGRLNGFTVRTALFAFSDSVKGLAKFILQLFRLR
jgi:glycosyltransferase involved in cell wall biosynthesis